MFNIEATRWLGVWLDSQQKFISYINKRVKRAHITEMLIKGLTKTEKLIPRFMRQIQLAMVQSIAIYGRELW